MGVGCENDFRRHTRIDHIYVHGVEPGVQYKWAVGGHDFHDLLAGLDDAGFRSHLYIHDSPVDWRDNRRALDYIEMRGYLAPQNSQFGLYRYQVFLDLLAFLLQGRLQLRQHSLDRLFVRGYLSAR